MEAASARLEEIGNQRSTPAVNEKVTLLRLLGRIDEAMVLANEAVRQARFGGDREMLLLARIRRAVLLHAQGKSDRALVELADCATEAGAHDWPQVEAFALQHRGRVSFDREDYEAALRDFRDALTIRVRIRAEAELIDGSMLAIAITESKLGHPV
ncbi:hypothetical protein CLV46_2896 [Diaminobutyricimonas aerilata]|uniref:Tetratricopeptide repeat protein n=1 Tax=Diaminobutyricimonas aerilata TaxID=1162967 RepID=A0A2M9CN40_9MICO|nr:tetratricopeptide repeat protein [Diaminobutyricimonas aerilata]PJJ73310.1 hypothetical protein CLV46_2896 [Diaminobutyricimonas aerilata]